MPVNWAEEAKTNLFTELYLHASRTLSVPVTFTLKVEQGSSMDSGTLILAKMDT